MSSGPASPDKQTKPAESTPAPTPHPAAPSNPATPADSAAQAQRTAPDSTASEETVSAEAADERARGGSDAAGQNTAGQESPQRTRRVSVRRTPKLVPFFLGGLFLAFSAAVLTVYTTAPAADYTRQASLGYLTFFFSIITIPLAAVAWLTVEKILRKRRETYSIKPLGDR